MKILIATDMEGISGVMNWNQVLPNNDEYPRFCKIMTADVNAAVAGAFKGGATEVVVNDGHAEGRNILIEDLDPRARLHSGTCAPYSMVEGIQTKDVSAVFFVGFHARSGTARAVLAHTWSSTIANVWINDRLVGEIELIASVCGAFGTPVAMISGDQTTIGQAEEVLGPLETVVVKQSTSYESAECLHPDLTEKLILEAAFRAVSNLKKGKIGKLFEVETPVKLVIQYKSLELADQASNLPGVKRLDGTRIEITARDMPTAYLHFQAAMLD